jgi:L-ribulose-5-phosphate 3-epimerase
MKLELNKLGFMQGRLSPLQFNKVQAFPWEHWKEEFQLATTLNLNLIEWTIDNYRFEVNPLFTKHQEIRELQARHQVQIPSITDDEFMENPPWVIGKDLCIGRLRRIIDSMPNTGIGILVVPLVDNSSIKLSSEFQKIVIALFKEIHPLLKENNLRVAFELDLAPKAVIDFLDSLDESTFGINYDIGNSASLGFSPDQEIQAYGARILNVHIKDRKFGGPTVPLGDGAADFKKVFELLATCNYEGNLIFQTARAVDENHLGVMSKYIKFTEQILESCS